MTTTASFALSSSAVPTARAPKAAPFYDDDDGASTADGGARLDIDGVAGNDSAMREMAAELGVQFDASHSPSRTARGGPARNIVFLQNISQMKNQRSIYRAADDDDTDSAADTPELGTGSSSGANAGVSDGIHIEQENPKRAGTASYERYERYKTASTLEEMLQLGGTRADYKYDMAKGFLVVLQGSAGAVSRSGGGSAASSSSPSQGDAAPVEAAPAESAPAARSLRRRRPSAAAATPSGSATASAHLSSAPLAAAAAPDDEGDGGSADDPWGWEKPLTKPPPPPLSGEILRRTQHTGPITYQVPGQRLQGRALIASSQAAVARSDSQQELETASGWVSIVRIKEAADTTAAEKGFRMAQEQETVQFLSATQVSLGVIHIEALVRSSTNAALVYPVKLTVYGGGALEAVCKCWGCDGATRLGMGKHGVAALAVLAVGADSAATTTTLCTREIFSRNGSRRTPAVRSSSGASYRGGAGQRRATSSASGSAERASVTSAAAAPQPAASLSSASAAAASRPAASSSSASAVAAPLPVASSGSSSAVAAPQPAASSSSASAATALRPTASSSSASTVAAPPPAASSAAGRPAQRPSGTRTGDPALSSKARKAVLCTGETVAHPPFQDSKIVLVWRSRLCEIVDEDLCEVTGNKGDGAEATRRLVATAAAPCEIVMNQGAYVRPQGGGRVSAKHNFDVRWKFHCRYEGCTQHGCVGWYYANKDAGAESDHAAVEVTVEFKGAPPVHYVAQEEFGVADLRGGSRRELVVSTTAALPVAQKRTPSNVFNAHVAAIAVPAIAVPAIAAPAIAAPATAASRSTSAPPPHHTNAAQPGSAAGTTAAVAQPRAPVAPSRAAVSSAMREVNDVSRDRDVWASCAALAAEARIEDETTVYLQELSTTPRGFRAVTFTRASIACYRAAARDEGAAFMDATGSVISDIRVRADQPAKKVHTLTLSVPTPAGGQMNRSKPLRVLTAHGTGMLSATEVRRLIAPRRLVVSRRLMVSRRLIVPRRLANAPRISWLLHRSGR